MDKGAINIFSRYFNKVCLYIDNSNFLNNLKEIDGNLDRGGRKIDYYKLCCFIIKELGNRLGINELDLSKVKLYDGLVINDEAKRLKKEKFLQAVKSRVNKGFCDKKVKVEFGIIELEIGRDHHIKGDDTLLATDIVMDITQRVCDFVVIVSGDGDFHSVIHIIKNKFRIPTVVAFFEDFVSGRLREEADIFIPLDIDRIQMD